MYKTYENTIILTRGDSAHFEIEVVDSKGNPVELPDTTTVTFTVKQSINDKTALITKHGLAVNIDPADTSTLEYGTYVYDVQLTYQDGAVDTIITPSSFIVTGEVTY